MTILCRKVEPAPYLLGAFRLQSLLRVQQGLDGFGGMSGCVMGKVTSLAVQAHSRVMTVDAKTKTTMLSLVKKKKKSVSFASSAPAVQVVAAFVCNLQGNTAEGAAQVQHQRRNPLDVTVQYF